MALPLAEMGDCIDKLDGESKLTIELAPRIPMYLVSIITYTLSGVSLFQGGQYIISLPQERIKNIIPYRLELDIRE